MLDINMSILSASDGDYCLFIDNDPSANFPSNLIPLLAYDYFGMTGIYRHVFGFDRADMTLRYN